MSLSKDPQVQDRQLEQKRLVLEANLSTSAEDLPAASSEAAGIVKISGAVGARSVQIDVKEAVKSVQKVQIVNKETGEVQALASAPQISAPAGSPVGTEATAITVTVDGTALGKACIEVLYRNK